MPTLSSIGMDQSLRDRLAGICSRRPCVCGRPTVFADSSATAAAAAAACAGQLQSGLAIRTPQALLSRDPKAVAHGLRITLPETLNLRSAVADAMTATTSVGRDAANLVGDVSKSILLAGRKRQRDEGEGERGDIAKLNNDDGNTYHNMGLFHRRRPPPVVVGAVTALDLCIHSATLADDLPSNLQVGTGSTALDCLLAPHADLADGGIATKIYHSSVLPVEKNGRAAYLQADGSTRFFGPDVSALPPTQQQGGIRLGYVTEVYGPSSSGKTQLALTIAANAAIKGWNVHYLAGGGGSSSALPLARRLKSLCQSRISSPRVEKRHRQIMLRAALERVGFVTVQDGHRALTALADIGKDIVSAPPCEIDERHQEENDSSAASSSSSSSNNIVIFDSASGCLSSDLFADGDGGLGAALVEDICFTLRKLARSVGVSSNCRCRCAVLVVNAASGQKAALGTGWRAADVQVRLDVLRDDYPDREQQQHQPHPVSGLIVSTKRIVKATLLKHCGKSVSAREDDDSRSATFAITANGVVDKEGGI